MRNPTSTYRVQLSPEFTFDALQEILDYLEEFGISTIYSAPFFQARRGSSHGYDIIDPFKISREIGRLETFRNITRRLQQKKMGWLQDIVPNHMAFDGNNVWLQDIFELGPESRYYNFFDVDWQYENRGKLMAPFLGNPLQEVLQKKELQLGYSKRGFSVNYFDHNYAASARSYSKILSTAGDGKWSEKFDKFSGEKENWQELKEFFVREVEKTPELRKEINDLLKKVNASEENLNEILDLQYFLPAHWKKTEEEINYRRFFTINDLICLSVEKKEVYESYHRFILQLCEGNLITGLRIDHIDGLFDPKGYLENLRESLGDDFYISIEKILEWDEKLPVHWPVQGTSGYGFLAAVNQVLTDGESEETFTSAYNKINPRNSEYANLVYKQKLFILKERMGGEYNNLWELAQELELLEKESKNEHFKEALGAFLAAFPVYRIYPEEYPLRKRQGKIIETAYQNALEQNENLKEQLEVWKNVFVGEADKNRDNMLYFLQRCQQFTGPLAAKGAEDTSFYIFNKLISHNEVGDSPENFGLNVSGFHERMRKRMEDFPLSINATSTHDTKRGEDARMRINVLSELGEEWFEKVKEWKEIGTSIREKGTAPDANEEYFIFQMLIGAWPFKGEPGEEFVDRSTAYLQKVLREAKENSSWAAPDEEYENRVYDYLKSLLKKGKFRSSFLDFQERIKGYGALKSLSQSVLKITAPGIPDIYQGSECWDLSYVDPDNRRPVDYTYRKNVLSEIKAFSSESIKEELKGLKLNFFNGKIKMYCIHRALQVRNSFKEVFEVGEYIPLEVSGKYLETVLAFARKQGDKYVLVIVPVLVTGLFDHDLNLKNSVGEEEILKLPEGFPQEWKNAFSEEIFDIKQFSAGDLFEHFPVALLTNS